MTTYIAGQAVEASADPRVLADAGPQPWDGNPSGLTLDADRVLVSVPPRIRDYVIQQKKIAASLLEGDATLAPLKNTWTEFDTTTKPIRERRAAEQAQDAAERGYAQGPQQGMLEVRGLANDARAVGEIRELLAAQVETKLKALDEAEQAARAELDDPKSWRPTAEDMAAVVELRQSIQLMGPTYAVPILLRQLVIEPAISGKGLGKATALLPIIRNLYETNHPTGYDQKGDPRPRGWRTHEVEDVIAQAETVRQDAAYYANHQKLRQINIARFKLAVLADEYAKGLGKFGGPTKWYADFGAPQQKAYEGLPVISKADRSIVPDPLGRLA
jgi:hypothetical protein